MRARTPLGRTVAVGAWAACTALAAVAAARFAFWDRRVVIVALDGLSPLLLFPAWFLAGAALLARKRLLGLIGVALVIAHVAVVAPELSAREPVTNAAGAPYRLLLANVKIDTAQAAAVAELIRRARPDVVVLVEGPEELATQVLETSQDGMTLATQFPHRFQVARHDPFAMAILSRVPIEGASVTYSGDRPVAVVMSVDGGRSRLVASHAVAPVGLGRDGWEADIAAIGAAAEDGRVPTVVAGDFNATWNHRPFRRLLDRGFTDAAAARGRPFDTTWPRHFRLVPPLMRVDHVLTRGDAEVTRIRTLDLAGSDHRAIIADINVYGR